MKRSNPIARALRSPHLQPKIKPSGKIYTRKGRTKVRPSAF